MNSRIVCLLPMRHESVRIPGKNFRSFGGAPLYEHIVATVLACEDVAEIVVDTDSPIIAKGLAKRPRVQILERPEHLRGGSVSMNEILLHDVRQVGADHYLQTHSTNPLLKTETISLAIDTYLGGYPRHDTLFSVTRMQTRLWSSEGRPINHDPEVLLNTQDLPPIFEENSCLYLFTRQTLEERRTRIGHRPYLFEISREEAWDIDTESDFRLAEHFYAQNSEGRAPPLSMR